MQAITLMGHIIGGFPSKSQSLQAGLGIIEAGAKYLEIQFPFSDPSADGVIIQEACDTAIKKGFKIQDGFDIVKTLSQKTQILIMTYANIAFSYGIEHFVKTAKENGARGLIIPDLPIHQDEDLRKMAKKFKIDVIELITPNTTPDRMQFISKHSTCNFIYAVARTGTTGSKTIINQELIQYLSIIRKYCNKKIALGFGIQSYEQVKQIKDKVDIIVAGSYFVEQIAKDSSTQALKKHTLRLIQES